MGMGVSECVCVSVCVCVCAAAGLVQVAGVLGTLANQGEARVCCPNFPRFEGAEKIACRLPARCHARSNATGNKTSNFQTAWLSLRLYDFLAFAPLRAPGIERYL